MKRAWLALRAALPDRWNAMALVAMSALGGGVWGQWGAPWAFMLWGVLLLVPYVVHAWESAR